MENPTNEVEEIIENGVIEKKVRPIKIENSKMEFSKSLGNLAGALSKAQGAMSAGKKGKQGYGYVYMDLATLIDVARKPLADNGLSFIQGHTLSRGDSPAMIIETLLMHESGEWIRTEMDAMITPMKGQSPIQSQGVSATYGRRYTLQAILGIASEEDTDGKAK